MSTDRDVTRVVRSWMDEGVTQLPDRVLDAVLDQLPATPQRRTVWLARRFLSMNTYLKFGLAAAAVVAAVVIGLQFIGQPNVVGPPDPTPSPTQTPAATSAAIPQVPTGALDPGTYLMPEPYGGMPFVFTLPAGWENPSGDEGYIRKNRDSTSILETTTGVNFAAWEVDAVYFDACQPEGTDEPVDDTVTALAMALARQAGRGTSDPVETVVDGYPAQMVELTAPADLSECGGSLRTWPGLNGDENSGWPAGPGQTDTVYIINVDGTRLVIVATHWAGTSPEDLAELEEVVASIQID